MTNLSATRALTNLQEKEITITFHKEKNPGRSSRTPRNLPFEVIRKYDVTLKCIFGASSIDIWEIQVLRVDLNPSQKEFIEFWAWHHRWTQMFFSFIRFLRPGHRPGRKTRVDLIGCSSLNKCSWRRKSNWTWLILVNLLFYSFRCRNWCGMCGIIYVAEKENIEVRLVN